MGAMSLIFNHFLIDYGEQAIARFEISSRLLHFPECILMGLCEGAFSYTANKLHMKHTIEFTIKAIIALLEIGKVPHNI